MKRGCLSWRLLVLALALVAVAAYFLNRSLVKMFQVGVDTAHHQLPALPDGFSLGDRELEAQGSIATTKLSGDSWTILLLLDPSGFADPQAALWMSALAELELPGDARILAIMSSPAIPGVLRGPAISMLEKQRAEMPFPIWMDFGREIADALRLPVGQVGIALLTPDGKPTLRFAGRCDESSVETVRSFVKAPPLRSKPNAPQCAALDRVIGSVADRKFTSIALVFLARPVAESEVPHFGGSPLAMLFRGMNPPSDPDVRLMTFLADAKGGDEALEILAGRVEGYSGRRWIRIADDVDLRGCFGVKADETALIVLDAQRIVRVDVRRELPMWRLALAGSQLGYKPPFDVSDSSAKPTDPAADSGR